MGRPVTREPEHCNKRSPGSATAEPLRWEPARHKEKPLQLNAAPTQRWRLKFHFQFGDFNYPQSCLTLCNPMVCSLPGSLVHGILQAILKWVTIPSPGNLPNPGTEQRSRHCRQILYHLSPQARSNCPPVRHFLPKNFHNSFKSFFCTSSLRPGPNPSYNLEYFQRLPRLLRVSSQPALPSSTPPSENFKNFVTISLSNCHRLKCIP